MNIKFYYHQRGSPILDSGKGREGEIIINDASVQTAKQYYCIVKLKLSALSSTSKIIITYDFNRKMQKHFSKEWRKTHKRGDFSNKGLPIFDI